MRGTEARSGGENRTEVRGRLRNPSTRSGTRKCCKAPLNSTVQADQPAGALCSPRPRLSLTRGLAPALTLCVGSEGSNLRTHILWFFVNTNRRRSPSVIRTKNGPKTSQNREILAPNSVFPKKIACGADRDRGASGKNTVYLEYTYYVNILEDAYPLRRSHSFLYMARTW